MGFLGLIAQHLGAKLVYDNAIFSAATNSNQADVNQMDGILTAFVWGPVTVQILQEGKKFGYRLILPEMKDYESVLSFDDPESAAAKALMTIRFLRAKAQQT